MKPIDFPEHTRRQMLERGASEAEIEEAVRSATWEPAKLGRRQSRLNFEFNGYWYGRYYRTKQVHAIFAEEDDYIAMVTVKVYYF